MSPQTISFAPVTVNRAAVPSPVIVSIPHAGRIYPQEILDEARVPQAVLEQFEDRWSDLIARKAQAEGATIITAQYARVVADCNRAEQQMARTEVANDLRGQMNAVGMKERAGLGVIPTRVGTAGVLWRRPIDHASLERRLNMVHRPYHHAIDQEITCALHQHGYAVLIDLHSMPSISANRVGYGQKLIVGDLFGASGADWLTGAAIEMGQHMGLPVGLNRPYAGGHILERHAAPKRQVYGVQLEWDRSLYLTPNGEPCVNALIKLEKKFADFVALVSRGNPRHHHMDVAAE